jgi:hypothetical protein
MHVPEVSRLQKNDVRAPIFVFTKRACNRETNCITFSSECVLWLLQRGSAPAKNVVKERTTLHSLNWSRRFGGIYCVAAHESLVLFVHTPIFFAELMWAFPSLNSMFTLFGTKLRTGYSYKCTCPASGTSNARIL